MIWVFEYICDVGLHIVIIFAQKYNNNETHWYFSDWIVNKMNIHNLFSFIFFLWKESKIEIW